MSPGSATGARVGDACPAFIVAEAKSYELVAYRLGKEGEEAVQGVAEKVITTSD